MLNQIFLIKDKKPIIKWKITDDTRDIVGYLCRRANGLIHDSVYVVAFYTNKIPLPTGPESFQGLPGMILGLAIPYENVTWFATQVTEKKNASEIFLTPKRGKIITRKELIDFLSTTLKSMRTFRNRVYYYRNVFTDLVCNSSTYFIIGKHSTLIYNSSCIDLNWSSSLFKYTFLRRKLPVPC